MFRFFQWHVVSFTAAHCKPAVLRKALSDQSHAVCAWCFNCCKWQHFPATAMAQLPQKPIHPRFLWETHSSTVSVWNFVMFFVFFFFQVFLDSNYHLNKPQGCTDTQGFIIDFQKFQQGFRNCLGVSFLIQANSSPAWYSRHFSS